MRSRGAVRPGTARRVGVRGAVAPARLPLSRAGAEARGAARWVPPRRAVGGADGREAPAARRGWVARLAGAARGGAARCGARWGARCACPGRDPRCLAWPASAVVPRGMDHAAAKTAMQSARERRFMTIPSLWTIPLGASPPIVACADSWIRDRRQIDKHAACQPAGSPGPSPRSPLRGPVGRPRRPRRRRRGRGQRAGGFPGAAGGPAAPPRRRRRGRGSEPAASCPDSPVSLPGGRVSVGEHGRGDLRLSADLDRRGVRTSRADHPGRRNRVAPSRRPVATTVPCAAARRRTRPTRACSCILLPWCGLCYGLAGIRPPHDRVPRGMDRQGRMSDHPGGRRSDDERDSHEFLRAL